MSILTEATGYIDGPNSIAIYGRDNRVPTAIVIAPNLHTGPYTVVELQSSKILGANTDDIPAILDFIISVTKKKDYPILSDKLKATIPSRYFTYREMTKNALYQFFLKKTNWGPQAFKDLFDELPEGETKGMYGAKVLYPENMPEKKKEEFASLLSIAHSVLTEHQVEWVMKLPINIVSAPSGGLVAARGLYYPTTHELQINGAMAFNDRMLQTIYHELGHALYFRYMSASDRQFIKDQYQGHEVRDVTEVTLPIGTNIRYVGRKSIAKAGEYFTITAFDGKEYDISARFGPYTYRGKTYHSFHVPPEVLTNGDWERKVGNDYQLIQVGQTDGWFPTQYSTKNHEEWWAELFSFYLLDKLSPEVRDWVKEMIDKAR